MSKVILITGGTSGIGQAIAHYMAKRNFKVYATRRNTSPADESTGIHFLTMDVTLPEKIRQEIDILIETEKRVDVLINNAGISMAGPLEETPLTEIRRVFETNFFGMVQVTQQVLPAMRRQHDGLIINISSIGGLMGLPFYGVYSASKHAVEGFSESLSMEVRPFGIKVCLIEPGEYQSRLAANRRVQSVSELSPYFDNFQKFNRVSGQESQRARDPHEIARLVYQIINRPNPAVRYKTGTLMEKLTPALKNILPSRMFEKLIMDHYGINDEPRF